MISVPLSWYPRLLHGTLAERNNWRLIGQGEGIHWPDLDEDVSVENLVLGLPSGESQRSFKQWLEARATGKRYRFLTTRALFYMAIFFSSKKGGLNNVTHPTSKILEIIILMGWHPSYF